MTDMNQIETDEEDRDDHAPDQVETVRLATRKDYPASRLMELSSRISTGDDFMDAFDVAETVLGENVGQGSLFAYLFRRFGYPNRGSDPHKDLVSYMLTTTRSDMLLRITPYAGGDVSLGFSFYVPDDVSENSRRWIRRDRDRHQAEFLDWIETEGRIPEWADETAEAMVEGGWPIEDGTTGWRRMMIGAAMISRPNGGEEDEPGKIRVIEWYRSVRADYEAIHPVPPLQWRSRDVAAWSDDDPMKPYAEAMMATLRDLLRPVYVRDVAIGIYGVIDEQHPHALGNVGPAAEEAGVAGMPSGDLANSDPEGFADLHGAILRLDPDPVAAIARATAILTAANDGAKADSE